MPQAVNIVLTDAAVFPVDHTFVPNGKEGSTYWFVDRSQANAIGYWRISVELKAPSAPTAGMSSKERNFRVKIGLHEPVLETISNSTVSGIVPAPTIGYIPRSLHEFIMSERTTVLDRQHLRKMSANLLANNQIKQVVEYLEPLFG